MKNIFLSLLAIFAVVGTASAQDATVNRSLSFYFDAFSGELTEAPGFEDGDLSRMLSGNEFEFGMTYSQNFATATWLSMWVKALFVVGQRTTYDNATGNFLGNGGGNMNMLANPRVQLGLNFGGYAILAMDTRGLIAQENFYTIALPGNGGSFTFMTILEFWAVPQVLDVDTYELPDGEEGMYGDSLGTGRGTTIVDLFALRVDYSIAFAQNWRYTTKLAFRFSGGGGFDHSATTFFQDGFQIRWENQIAWNVTPSFSMWTQLRYRIDNLASNASLPIDHRIYLQAGLGYSFDFSGN